MSNAETKTGQRLYSVSRLAVEFGLHRQTVSKRLRGCKPCGLISKNKAYTLQKAAPFLIDDRIDPDAPDDFIDPERLAPEDQNQYYSAQLKKQRLEEEQGDLWRTEQVALHVSNLLKLLAMEIGQVPETLSKMTAITAKQKNEVRKAMARIRTQMYSKVVDDFGGSAKLPDD